MVVIAARATLRAVYSSGYAVAHAVPLIVAVGEVYDGAVALKLTDVVLNDGTSGGTDETDKSDIVGATLNVVTGFVYVGAKLEGSAITCEDIVGSVGVTAVNEKAPGSLSPNGLLSSSASQKSSNETCVGCPGYV